MRFSITRAMDASSRNSLWLDRVVLTLKSAYLCILVQDEALYKYCSNKLRSTAENKVSKRKWTVLRTRIRTPSTPRPQLRLSISLRFHCSGLVWYGSCSAAMFWWWRRDNLQDIRCIFRLCGQIVRKCEAYNPKTFKGFPRMCTVMFIHNLTENEALHWLIGSRLKRSTILYCNQE